MSASDHLSHLQFGHDEDPYHVDRHSIDAYHQGAKIGTLEWHGPEGKYPNEIQHVEVDSGFRRQGIASEMLRRARAITPTIQHSSELSPEGEAFADANPLPEPPSEVLNPVRPRQSWDDVLAAMRGER